MGGGYTVRLEIAYCRRYSLGPILANYMQNTRLFTYNSRGRPCDGDGVTYAPGYGEQHSIVRACFVWRTGSTSERRELDAYLRDKS